MIQRPIAANLSYREALIIAEADLIESLPVAFGDPMLCRTQSDLNEYFVTDRPFTEAARDEANEVFNEITTRRRAHTKSKSKGKLKQHPRQSWAIEVRRVVSRWEMKRSRERRAEQLALRSAQA